MFLVLLVVFFSCGHLITFLDNSLGLDVKIELNKILVRSVRDFIWLVSPA